MLEPMTVRAEVWPLLADDAGLWLLSGHDAWRSGVIMADSDIHFEADGLLCDHAIQPDEVAALHSTSATAPGAQWTSWRADGTSVIHTYMAVIAAPGFARERWPDACPVTVELLAAVGRPPTHAAAAAPLPRYVDVLAHGLRHLRDLMESNAENAAAMGPPWRRHLEPFDRALATMYDQRHEPAA